MDDLTPIQAAFRQRLKELTTMWPNIGEYLANVDWMVAELRTAADACENFAKEVKGG